MRRLETGLLAFVLTVSGVIHACADSRPNPYVAIVDRNPFQLKPIPPPPPPAEPPAPVVPLAKVVLTGITSMFGPTPRALLEITEQEPGKTPTVKKPILRQGEREGSIEVLSIDVKTSMVRIKNGTIETNVTFEVAKSTPSGPAPPPGMAPPVPPALPNAHASAAAAGSPMIISPGGASTPGRSGSGVSTYGGDNTAIPPPTSNPGANYANSAATYANPSSTYAGMGANRLGVGVNTYGAADASRPSRMGDNAQKPADPHTQAMNSYIGIEQLREQNRIISAQKGIPPLPLPQTPLTKMLQEPPPNH